MGKGVTNLTDEVQPPNPALFLPAPETSTSKVDSEVLSQVEDGTLTSIQEDVIGEVSIAELEQEMIERTLDKFRGNRRKTAQILDISERTLYRKINEYGINKKYKDS